MRNAYTNSAYRLIRNRRHWIPMCSVGGRAVLQWILRKEHWVCLVREFNWLRVWSHGCLLWTFGFEKISEYFLCSLQTISLATPVIFKVFGDWWSIVKPHHNTEYLLVAGGGVAGEHATTAGLLDIEASLVVSTLEPKDTHWLIDWFTLGSSPYGPDAPKPYRRTLCTP